MDIRKYIPLSADDIEGEIGGCAMDALREDKRHFKTPPDAYDIKWFVSFERSELDEDKPRYALAIHESSRFILDLDWYERALDEEIDSNSVNTSIDECWNVAQ